MRRRSWRRSSRASKRCRAPSSFVLHAQSRSKLSTIPRTRWMTRVGAGAAEAFQAGLAAIKPHRALTWPSAAWQSFRTLRGCQSRDFARIEAEQFSATIGHEIRVPRRAPNDIHRDQARVRKPDSKSVARFLGDQLTEGARSGREG